MERELFHGYCYGPVDLLSVEKSRRTMRLQLRTAAGDRARAVYEDCVYWQLGSEEVGLHLPLIQRLSAEELLQHSSSPVLWELKKNSSNVQELLEEWEQEGLLFYLHYGPRRNSEFMVAARHLDYQEQS